MARLFDEEAVAHALREAGASFAFVHGSRASGEHCPDSDLDVAAWWASAPPAPWEVPLPAGVDLVVLNEAPLWLAGRVALRGRILFDDDPPARVAWQGDTRTFYLDELPYMHESQREWLQRVSHGR